MNKGLTIDSRWRDENNGVQNTRDEFGIISLEQAVRIIKRYLADETKDIQVTWEARRNVNPRFTRKQIVGKTTSQIIVDDPLKPDYEAQLADLMKGKREGGFA